MLYIVQHLMAGFLDKKNLQTMRTQITMNDGTSWQEGELISEMITDIDGKPVTFDDLDENLDGKITVDEYVLNTCRVHTCSF